MLHVTLVGQPDARIAYDLDALAEALAPLDIAWGDNGRKAMTLEAMENGLRGRLHVENMNGQSTAIGNRIDYGRAVLLVGRVE